MPRRGGTVLDGDAMTSDETGGPESGTPGTGRRRPPSTIELEATEVADETTSGADRPSPETEAPPPSGPPPAPNGAANARGSFGPALAGGVLGAAITAALLVALWLA